MLQEHFIDLPGRYFLSTAIDDLLATARDEQVPVVVEKSVIPCLEPVTCKRILGRESVTIVARHDACATDNNLAGSAGREQASFFVHDGDVQLHWQTDRTRLALTRRLRIA